jgi:uncharacterized protein with NRDE domain
MCIFFFVVGDDNYPTLLCNNRDEYFLKKTARGCFVRGDGILDMEDVLKYSDARYFPLDLEGKGSWMSFTHVNSETNHLRFAVVLNLDNNSIIPNKSEQGALKSRGRLVKDFITSNITAEEFAFSVFNERGDYRPFNLLLSDGFGGAYYVTSSSKQATPMKLSTGTLYGITNGYLEDPWEKTEAGIAQFQELFRQESFEEIYKEDIESKLEMRIPVEHEVQFHPLGTFTTSEVKQQVTVTSHSRLNTFMLQTLKIMLDDTPREDADFGWNHLPLVHLSSIYARPTIALKVTYVPLFVEKERYKLLEEDPSYNPEEVFGTRTVTNLLHYSQRYIQTHLMKDMTKDMTINKEQITGRFILIEDDIQYENYPNQLHNLHVFEHF